MPAPAAHLRVRRERKVHDLLLNLRDSITAHSDADHRALRVAPIIAEPGKAAWFSKAIHVYPHDEEIGAVPKMIEKIVGVARSMINRLASDPQTLRLSGVQVTTFNFSSVDVERMPFSICDIKNLTACSC
jgi:hypothetical protein